MWLYNYAVFNEQQALLQKQALSTEGIYGQKPSKGGRRTKGTKNKKRGEGDSEDEEVEEDTMIGFGKLQKTKKGTGNV